LVATGPVSEMSSPGVPSVTPIRVTPFRVASNSRQFPAALVSPVLIPVAPAYFPISGSVFCHLYAWCPFPAGSE
jgi:hypothetical protein